MQASILAHLPLTLHQLDVRECEALRDALKDAQHAQRRREQAPPAQIQDAMNTERAALDKLASLIRDNQEHQHFLWSRVQELMRRFGYRDDSVLLELAQNADDALSQASEIAGAPLPPTARRLLVRVHFRDGVTTIDVRHHGRPINDTGGTAFPAGRDRQWDQDLYFMMLLNLSGKPWGVPRTNCRRRDHWQVWSRVQVGPSRLGHPICRQRLHRLLDRGGLAAVRATGPERPGPTTGR